MAHKKTIYEALAEKLGRHPTNAELKADVERIKTEALQELAAKGKLPHQRKGRRNPAVSPEQYRLAQAVLSGTARESGMSKKAAQEIVERTPKKLRSEYSKRNPPLYTSADVKKETPPYAKVTFVRGLIFFRPKSNLKPFTPEQEDELKGIAARFGFSVSRTGVDYEQIKPGMGWRLYRSNPKSNPAADSAAMYESFHGRESTGTLEIAEQVHYHENLAELGTALGVKVRVGGVNGKDFTIEFEGIKQAQGASNPRKRIVDVVMSEHIRVPGFPQIVVTRSWLHKWLKGLGWSSKELDRMAFGSRAVSEDLTPAPMRDKWLREVEAEYKQNPRTRKGPLTQAYEFGTGIIPGALKGADSALGKAIGNPRRRPFEKLSQAAQQRAYRDYLKKTKDTITFEQFVRMVADFVDWLPSGKPYMQHRNPSASTVILCSNEKGTQLYFRGGDQAVNLSSLPLPENAARHDHVLIGECWGIAYETEKDFDDFDPIQYVHILGPEKNVPKQTGDLWENAKPPERSFGAGLLPILTYDTMNKTLSLAGGVYKIDKPLLSTSPGIED